MWTATDWIIRIAVVVVAGPIALFGVLLFVNLLGAAWRGK